ncbi:MAG: hypothetical protein U0893_09595 [Chloroflexota bacterium]
MRESTTYQAILEEGREEGQLLDARRMVVELGTAKFGAPDLAASAALETIGDLAALHRLAVGVLRVSSWQELLSMLPGC